MEPKAEPALHRRLLVLFAALATAGLFAMALTPRNEGAQIAMALASIPVFVLLVVVFLMLVTLALRRAPFSGIVSACLAMAGLAAALGGAYLLVALACSAGGLR